jgi:hypothetical protein
MTLFVSFLQMQLAALCLLAVWASIAVASPAINEIRQTTSRPGRFLSLPVPSKCSQSKQPLIIACLKHL